MSDVEYIVLSLMKFPLPEERFEIYNCDKKDDKKSEWLTQKVYLNSQEFNKIVDILNENHIQEWNKEYINEHVLDGESWEIKYNINGNKRIIHGINCYPRGWETVKKAIIEAVAFKTVKYKEGEK